ncbi:MAG: VPLPA-CTERM-specific exosortase XrtD [Pseudomonadota bacterium]
MTIWSSDYKLSEGKWADGYVGLMWLALATFAAFVFLWEGVVALVDAWQLAEYSHGPLIPILSGLMFLRQLKNHPPRPGPVADRWPGVALIVLSLLVGLLGNLARIPDIAAYALILWFGGLLLVSFGWKEGKRYWPPILHLVFMLPLPGLLYWKLSTTLQFISSEFGVYLVRLAGVPVFLDGNIIDLGSYKLHVAEACSGLRYLFPVLSFSYIFAVLYRGPMWHKAVLLISAAPITVVMNSVRIGIVGVMVDAYGIEHAEGFSHFMEGWVVFITCIILLFALARLMLLMLPEKMSLAEALDLDTSGLGAQAARLRLVRPSAALITATVIVCVTAVTWRLAPAPEAPQISRAPLVLFPREIGDWKTARLSTLEPGIERVLAADDYYAGVLTRDSASTDGASTESATDSVDVFVAWYADQTKGGIHSPEVCIPGGGWEMSEIKQVDISAAVGSAAPFTVNRAIIQKGLVRSLVYFWFEQSSGRYASDYGAKAALVMSALTTGRTDGALIRLVTNIAPGEDIAVAEARLQDILPPMTDALPRFVPN